MAGRTLLIALGEVEPQAVADWDLVVPPAEGGMGARVKWGLARALTQQYGCAAVVAAATAASKPAIAALVRPLAAGDADIVFAVNGAERARSGARAPLRWQAMAATAEALSRLPFSRGSDDDLLAVELALQAELAVLRVVTIATNLRLGARLRPLAMLRAVTTARVQRFHILYDRRFDCAPPAPAYEQKLGYVTPHSLAAKLLAAGTRVLDLGAADGYVARLLAAQGCDVTAVDRAAPARDPGVPFVVHDLDRGLPPLDMSRFDAVLMLDVVEHLREPERFIDMLAGALAEKARLIISTGNVAFIVTRLMLLVGQFNYGRRGILDLTHTRLFTRSALRRLLHEAGLRVVAQHAIPAPFPAALGHGFFARLLTAANGALARMLPGLFAYQVLLVAVPARLGAGASARPTSATR